MTMKNPFRKANADTSPSSRDTSAPTGDPTDTKAPSVSPAGDQGTGGTGNGRRTRLPPPKAKHIGLLPMIAALFALNWIIAGFLRGPAPTRVTLPYSTFIEQVTEHNVASISSRGATIQGELKEEVTYPPKTEGETTPVTAALFRTERPTFADDDLLATLKANGVTVGAEPIDQPVSLWVQLLTGVGPTLLFLGAMVWFLRKGMSASGLGSIGKSKAESPRRSSSK